MTQNTQQAMWSTIGYNKSALDIAKEFAGSYFGEPRKVRSLKSSDAPWFDGTFRLVGGRRVYHLWVDRKTYTWYIEVKEENA